MRIQGMVCFKFNCVLTCLLCVTPSIVKAQEQGCFLRGINLEPCLDLAQNYASDSCCKALNQALQVGIYCFCLLLSSSSPLLDIPFSLPLSNCFVSVPPITQCLAPKAAELGPPASPVPLPLSPAISKEVPQPPSPKNFVSPTVPSVEVLVPLNSTSDNNSTAATGKPQPSGKGAPYLNMCGNANKMKNLLHLKMLLAITLLACML